MPSDQQFDVVVVGAGNATRQLKNGEMITVDTTGSEGKIYAGTLKFDVYEHKLSNIPKIKTKIAMNIATPDTAFEKSFLPNNGVGLAREEFIIAAAVGVHPMALLHYKDLPPSLQRKIEHKTRGWHDTSSWMFNWN